MGGCRCTYRNCNVKSDGKTHMFHYPVFDRLRCHQWLLNAQKLDFLNLKVSQLKNRVVCQHHFKDDNFMNFKKDKLTFDAVPTENGPYCDPSQFPETNEDNLQSFALALDDIENDSLLCCDKKANYSVKYGDFLTNSELNFMNNLNTGYTNVNVRKDNFTDINKQKENEGVNLDAQTDSIVNITDVNNYRNTIILDSETHNKSTNQDKLSVSSPMNKCTSANLIQFEKDNNCQENGNSNNTQEPFVYIDFPNTKVSRISKDMMKKNEPKVKIISEKKIKEPFQIPNNLKSVSPSLLIQIPQRKKNQQETTSADEVSQSPSKNSNFMIKPLTKQYTVNLEYDSDSDHKKTEMSSKENVNSNLNRLSPKRPIQGKVVQPKMSLLKNKISPQRIAAIKEKRKFNMKLRDIIETCLDKKTIVINKQQQNSHNANTKECFNIEEVNNSLEGANVLSYRQESLGPQEFTIAYLDARMKSLENTLLNRIDENTKKIIELKNSINTTSNSKAHSSLQNHSSEESYKKYLYQEISKYLSPSSNSLVYEELFINKYSLNNDASGTKLKRRRCR